MYTASTRFIESRWSRGLARGGDESSTKKKWRGFYLKFNAVFWIVGRGRARPPCLCCAGWKRRRRSVFALVLAFRVFCMFRSILKLAYFCNSGFCILYFFSSHKTQGSPLHHGKPGHTVTVHRVFLAVWWLHWCASCRRSFCLGKTLLQLCWRLPPLVLQFTYSKIQTGIFHLCAIDAVDHKQSNRCRWSKDS